MPPTPAPWRSQFLSHISKLESPTFSLSTVALSEPESYTHGRPVPRVRTCVYRGMWTNPVTSDKNKAEPNPAAYESDCLMFTTDARMDKAADILQVKSGEQTKHTGGGGCVEAVFWVKDVMMQWRVRGDAWILGPDVETLADEAKKAKEAVRETMRVVDAEKAKDWSWGREVTYIFGAQSPMIRGKFKTR
jgi:pyridoxamine 5'-phosphate oxidase